MARDRIGKVYENLDAKARAMIAFGLLAQRNQNDLNAVWSSAPTRLYRTTDAETRGWFDGVFDFSAAWSMEHWKHQAQLERASLDALHAAVDQDLPRLQEAARRRMECDEYLLVLDVALEQLAEKYGFDPAATRTLAGARRHEPRVSCGSPPETFVEPVRTMFDALLTGPMRQCAD